MLASDIIDRARLVLNDTDNTSYRWADSEFLKWINDGQRAITLVRPDASVSVETMTCAAGTKQSLPNGAIRLLDVTRNINADNSVGRAVRLVDRDILDSQNPDWHSDTQEATVKNFIYDNRVPTVFYVYPPAKSTSKLEIVISKNPTDVSATSSTLAVADIYTEPLLNYVLFRAYNKDAEFAATTQLAVSYFQAFQAMLGIKTAKDVGYSPDLNSKGGNPNPAALQTGGV
jgi:hypothetical protein